MREQSISGWKQHVVDGTKYLNTALNGLSRPKVFNNELIFQLAAMAIEKMIVGVYQYHNEMPTDHTLSGLVDGLAAICPMNPGLSERIKRIEAMDNMCPLVPVRRESPEDTLIKEILDTGLDVADYARKNAPVDDHDPMAA